MTTSVVVATYNGEKFIIDQLLSIMNQTVPADEVLIFDDCSTDSTPQLCREFIETKQLSNWSFTVNEKNLGFSNNFLNGFSNANGDIIFISDQDDVWETNKIEVMLPIFENNNEILSLATTFSIYDQNMNLIRRHMNFHNKLKRGVKGISISEFCSFNSYMGMSMAFRKELFNLLSNDMKSVFTFDRLLNTLAVIENGLFFLDVPLVRRRSYASSVSNSEIIRDISTKYNNNIRLHKVYFDYKNIRGIKKMYDYSVHRDEVALAKIKSYLILSKNRVIYISNASVRQWLLNIKVSKYFTLLSYLMDGWCILKSKFR